MPDPSPPAPPEVCFGLWVTEDGTRGMRIERSQDGHARVTVWTSEPFREHERDRPSKWHPPGVSAESSRSARERVGYLEVELGDLVFGSSYVLMIATRNEDPPARGGFEWGAITSDTRRAEVRIFPERSASYYEAVVGYWDDNAEVLRDADSWMEPLSTWLPVADDAS